MNNNTSSPHKWFIYCRKSSDSEDKQIASLPAQVNELTELAKKLNLKVVAVYEESHSAFHPGRPKFNQMMDRIKKGEANCVLTWATNRIARNPIDGGTFVYFLQEGIIKELKTKGGSFTGTPEHLFAINIDFSVAQKSSNDLQVAVNRGNKHKFFERKEWGGPAKPGFINVTDPLTKINTIIPDPDRFKPIKEALHLLVYKGFTPMEALNTLNNEWHYMSRKTLKQGGKPLNRASWYKLIADPFYAGIMHRKIEGQQAEIAHTHEPMLTPGEFERLQIRLGRRGKPHYTKRQLPYKVLQCGECGGHITCSQKWHITCSECNKKFPRGKKTDKCPRCHTFIDEMKDPKLHCYTHYECINKKKKNGCSQGSLNIDEIERKIDHELSRYEIPKEFADWAIKYLNELNSAEEQQDTQAKESLHKHYAYTDQQLKNLIRLRISPDYIDYDNDRKALYEEEEQRLIQIKKKLKQDIEKADQKQEEWIELAKDTFDFVSQARYWFEHGSIQDKTYVLEKLGSNLLVFDRQLLIDGQKAYFLIEKGKQECLEAAGKFEPNKNIQLSGEMLNLEPVCQAWRRERDSNPRYLAIRRFSKPLH